MKPISLRLIAFFCLISAFIPLAAHAAAKPQRPNIVFIMVDDLGPEWISCYGAIDIRTPHIDKLAQHGLLFRNAYSMPKCTPTRATLLTGQYPFRHGWIGHWDVPRWGAGCHFDPKHNISFAQVMKQAGYATLAVGKWQINDFRVQSDIMQRHGFDESCMWTGYETGVKASAERYWDPYLNTNGVSKTHKKKFGEDVFTNYLIDFMGRHKDQPFLAYYPMALTHGPFVAPPINPNAQSPRQLHKAMVSYVDHLVGRIVGALDDLAIRQRTILIFTTDNGTTRSMAGRLKGQQNVRLVKGGKDTYWESGMWCPFIVNCPGLVPEGQETDELTDFTDMLPTFAELGGAELPRGVTLDGHSIAPLILGESKKGSRDWILAMGAGTMVRTADGVHARTPDSDRVIRNKRYKLWRMGGASTALYDLQEDPGEQNNLISATSGAAAQARAELEAALKALPADARPKYDPTPPQSWDRAIGAGKVKRRKKK